MRVLFLSNFYPPADRGGWEQWCQEVADAFIERGHHVAILTSRYQKESIRSVEPHVRRELFLESDLNHYRPADFFLHRASRERYNRDCLTSLVADFQPDVVFIWGMWLLDSQLAVHAERLCSDRVAYYFCGYWPVEPDSHTAFWTGAEPRRWVGVIKRPVARVAKVILAGERHTTPELRYMACVSQAVLSVLGARGFTAPGARVIYGGIQLDQYYRPISERTCQPESPNSLRLLYAGALTPEKGVHTALQAMAFLTARLDPTQIHLTLVGRGHPDFEARLQRFVVDNRLAPYVAFKDWVPRTAMPGILRNFDVLVFPSEWQEPLARMMMQGLAAGLVLVATTTGGSGEILENEVNSLTFPAGDADALAIQILRLIEEPELRLRLARAGQQTALERFDFRRMVDELDTFVHEVARSADH